MSRLPPTGPPGTLRVVPGGSGDRTPSPRATRIFIWVFSVVMVITAGTAFIFKLTEFILTATREGPGSLASFLIPVLNYLLVAAGFACLFLWAFARGQFRDLEGPKYRMLEINRRLDELERETAPSRPGPGVRG